METIRSKDGTTIAFDRLGYGSPVIVVGGLLCDRALTRSTAEELAKHFTVFNYDRRGRGDSGDTVPYAVEREIEDIGALVAEAGGTASVYGHSSGAGLALHAAAHGLPITKLVLHEPPYVPDDEEERRNSQEIGEKLKTLLSVTIVRGVVCRLRLPSRGRHPRPAHAVGADRGGTPCGWVIRSDWWTRPRHRRPVYMTPPRQIEVRRKDAQKDVETAPRGGATLLVARGTGWGKNRGQRETDPSVRAKARRVDRLCS